jgi:hypothetical protein
MSSAQLLDVDLWVTVRVLAEAARVPVHHIYRALYDPDRPMPCSRRGRSIRVRLADWQNYWDQRTQPVIKREPPRAYRAKPQGVASESRRGDVQR